MEYFDSCGENANSNKNNPIGISFFIASFCLTLLSYCFGQGYTTFVYQLSHLIHARTYNLLFIYNFNVKIVVNNFNVILLWNIIVYYIHSKLPRINLQKNYVTYTYRKNVIAQQFYSANRYTYPRIIFSFA